MVISFRPQLQERDITILLKIVQVLGVGEVGNRTRKFSKWSVPSPVDNSSIQIDRVAPWHLLYPYDPCRTYPQ